MDAYELLDILTDERILKILIFTQKKPRSVRQLAKTLKIDKSHIYPIVKQLCESGLLTTIDRRRTRGKKHALTYQSQVDSAHILIYDSFLEAQIKFSGKELKRFDENIFEKKHKVQKLFFPVDPLNVIRNIYSLKILFLTENQTSILEIANLLSTSYKLTAKRIQTLQQEGYLEVMGAHSFKFGNPKKMFKSNFKSAELTYRDAKFTYVIERVRKKSLKGYLY